MIETLGYRLISIAESLMELGKLPVGTFAALFRQLISFRFRKQETLDQLYIVAVQSVPIVGICLLFVSFMMVAEFSFHMKLVLKQDSLVPAFSTVLMLRELGPVLTCLLLTSRVGAGIAAEAGTMKVTEQLDALSLLGISAIDYLVVPRFVACLAGGVALSVIAAALSMFGGALLGSGQLDYNVEQYFQVMFLYTRFSDLGACMLKGAVFGAVIPFAACYQGFRCKAGSEGVGDAATNAVVQGSMAIIIMDFLLTYLLYAL